MLPRMRGSSPISRRRTSTARRDRRAARCRSRRSTKSRPSCYLARVRAAQEYIAAGDIYQANLSRPWRLKLRDGVDRRPGLQRAASRESGAVCRLRAAGGWIDLLVVARAAAAHHGPRDFDAADRRHARRAGDRPSRTGAIPPSSWRIRRNAPSTSC